MKPLLFHNDIEDNVEQNEFMDSSYSIHLDNFFRHAALCSTVNESEGEGEGEGRRGGQRERENNEGMRERA